MAPLRLRPIYTSLTDVTRPGFPKNANRWD
jgi:hypothetical protein